MHGHSAWLCDSGALLAAHRHRSTVGKHRPQPDSHSGRLRLSPTRLPLLCVPGACSLTIAISPISDNGGAVALGACQSLRLSDSHRTSIARSLSSLSGAAAVLGIVSVSAQATFQHTLTGSSIASGWTKVR